MTLRRRNELFQAVAAVGLDMATFDFEHDGNSAKVAHRPTGSTFVVSEIPKGFNLNWQVTDGPHSDWNEGCGEWDDVFPVANFWAGEVQYINGTRDFWQEIKKVSAALAPIQQEDVTGTPFTADEQAEISQHMETVKEQIRQAPDLTAAQVRAIEQAINELNESAEKVNRKDWRLLLYGQAMNLFFAYAIPPQVVQGVITTVITGLGHMFGLGLPPSLPPQSIH